MAKLYECTTIELFRIKCMMDYLMDSVCKGAIHKDTAIALISNLVDTDKDEPDTEIENIVFNTIEHLKG